MHQLVSCLALVAAFHWLCMVQGRAISHDISSVQRACTNAESQSCSEANWKPHLLFRRGPPETVVATRRPPPGKRPVRTQSELNHISEGNEDEEGNVEKDDPEDDHRGRGRGSKKLTSQTKKVDVSRGKQLLTNFETGEVRQFEDASRHLYLRQAWRAVMNSAAKDWIEDVYHRELSNDGLTEVRLGGLPEKGVAVFGEANAGRVFIIARMKHLNGRQQQKALQTGFSSSSKNQNQARFGTELVVEMADDEETKLIEQSEKNRESLIQSGRVPHSTMYPKGGIEYRPGDTPYKLLYEPQKGQVKPAMKFVNGNKAKFGNRGKPLVVFTAVARDGSAVKVWSLRKDPNNKSRVAAKPEGLEDIPEE